MSESWTISVGGRVYGPYSLEQMRGFHAEGRLADHSLVARAGEDQFHAANEDVALALLFQPQAAAPTAQPEAPAAPHKFGAEVADAVGALVRKQAQLVARTVHQGGKNRSDVPVGTCHGDPHATR